MTITKEIAKKQLAVLIRGGIQIWIDEDKKDLLVSLMEAKKMVDIEGRVVNTVDIVGIFTAQDLEDRTYRKNGYWKCNEGNYWHLRGDQCAHGKRFY